MGRPFFVLNASEGLDWSFLPVVLSNKKPNF